MRRALGLFDEKNLFGVVDFLELDLDDLALRRLHAAPDERGLDGQFAMSAVDEHTELHTARAAMVEQRVERGARRAPGVEHIVTKDDIHVLDFAAEFALLD